MSSQKHQHFGGISRLSQQTPRNLETHPTTTMVLAILTIIARYVYYSVTVKEFRSNEIVLE
jgi:hypothetical protein